MMDAVIELLKRTFEKDEKSRRFAVDLADSYLRRISRFQDQLVILGIILNFLAAGFVLQLSRGGNFGPVKGMITAVLVFMANALLAKLYSNEHRTTKLLFAKYPELELIMVGDKSWSNFRVLAVTYKYLQAGWMLYFAVLSFLSAGWLSIG